MRTLIIVDYDDTLLCSSYVQQYPATTALELYPLAQAARQLLLQALASSEVVIVTNAHERWVYQSASQYLPSLLPLLLSLHVVSARDRFGHVCLRNPVRWKHYAFASVLQSYRPQQLLSCGDSFAEREVALAIAARSSHIQVKSVKLVDGPTPDQLQGQLEHLASSLPALLVQVGPVDVRLALKPT
jgi:hypothetical protein